MEIRFKCGCVAKVWAHRSLIKYAVSCCKKHERGPKENCGISDKTIKWVINPL